MSLDETRLHTLLGKMVNDMGAAAVAPLVILGDKLGLYKSLAAAGPLSTEDLAQQTGTTERYVREWCANGAPRRPDRGTSNSTPRQTGSV